MSKFREICREIQNLERSAGIWKKKNSGKSILKTLTVNKRFGEINYEVPDKNQRCKKQIRSTGNNKNARK